MATATITTLTVEAIPLFAAHLCTRQYDTGQEVTLSVLCANSEPGQYSGDCDCVSGRSKVKGMLIYTPAHRLKSVWNLLLLRHVNIFIAWFTFSIARLVR